MQVKNSILYTIIGFLALSVFLNVALIIVSVMIFSLTKNAAAKEELASKSFFSYPFVSSVDGETNRQGVVTMSHEISDANVILSETESEVMYIYNDEEIDSDEFEYIFKCTFSVDCCERDAQGLYDPKKDCRECVKKAIFDFPAYSEDDCRRRVSIDFHTAITHYLYSFFRKLEAEGSDFYRDGIIVIPQLKGVKKRKNLPFNCHGKCQATDFEVFYSSRNHYDLDEETQEKEKANAFSDYEIKSQGCEGSMIHENLNAASMSKAISTFSDHSLVRYCSDIERIDEELVLEGDPALVSIGMFERGVCEADYDSLHCHSPTPPEGRLVSAKWTFQESWESK